MQITEKLFEKPHISTFVGYKSCVYVWKNMKVNPRSIIEALNQYPSNWTRNLIIDSPVDMLMVLKKWRKDPPPEEILQDFKKTLGHHIYFALLRLVGTQSKINLLLEFFLLWFETNFYCLSCTEKWLW